MRIGSNPQKNIIRKDEEYFHQVIIPIYIPHQKGYFKDSYKILQYCIESLCKTVHSQTYVSVINNGSCKIVSEYLDEIKKENKIQELIHTSRIGKVNALLKGIVGHNFPLLTITDADVLFLNNWQKEVYKIFAAFPKSGMVCTSPSSKSYKTHVSNIYWDLFFSKKLKFENVIDPDALKAFANSIENPFFYNNFHLEKYLTVTIDKVMAVVGAGHFSGTYRREIFRNMHSTYSPYQLGGGSVTKYLDIPVVKKGFWRLSTAGNFSYHMGNIKEKWMEIKLKELDIQHGNVPAPSLKEINTPLISNYVKNSLFSKIIYKKYFLKLFFISKGLSSTKVQDYLK